MLYVDYLIMWQEERYINKMESWMGLGKYKIYVYHYLKINCRTYKYLHSITFYQLNIYKFFQEMLYYLISKCNFFSIVNVND